MRRGVVREGRGRILWHCRAVGVGRPAPVRTRPADAARRRAEPPRCRGLGLRLHSTRKPLGHLAGIAWYESPLDCLVTWRPQVEQVSEADIKAAFARKLQPEKMVTVILGAAK